MIWMRCLMLFCIALYFYFYFMLCYSFYYLNLFSVLSVGVDEMLTTCIACGHSFVSPTSQQQAPCIVHRSSFNSNNNNAACITCAHAAVYHLDQLTKYK